MMLTKVYDAYQSAWQARIDSCQQESILVWQQVILARQQSILAKLEPILAWQESALAPQESMFGRQESNLVLQINQWEV